MSTDPPEYPSSPFQGSKSVVIFGSGGHGRVIADTLRVGGFGIAGFLDDKPAAPTIDNLPVLGGTERLDQAEFLRAYAVVVGLGDGRMRRHVSLRVLERGGELARAIHPAAIIARDVTIGVGTVVMAGVVINTGTRIGRFVVVNTGAVLDHDNRIEDGVHISPGVHFAGAVSCGEDAFIGTGANVIPKIRIGARAIVAAGAAVIDEVPEDALAAGCPAVIKKFYSEIHSSGAPEIKT